MCRYHGWFLSAQNEKAVLLWIILQRGLCLLLHIFLLLLFFLFSLLSILTGLCPLLWVIAFFCLEKGATNNFLLRKGTAIKGAGDAQVQMCEQYFFVLLDFTGNHRPHVVAAWQLKSSDYLGSNASLRTELEQFKMWLQAFGCSF